MSLSFIYLELILWFVTYKPVVQGILQRGTTFYIWLSCTSARISTLIFKQGRRCSHSLGQCQIWNVKSSIKGHMTVHNLVKSHYVL